MSAARYLTLLPELEANSNRGSVSREYKNVLQRERLPSHITWISLRSPKPWIITSAPAFAMDLAIPRPIPTPVKL